MIPCMNKTLFGVECMGCGTQRALLLVLRGDFAAAFQMYPPIYTMLLFFGSIALHFIDKKRNYNKPIKYLAIINAAIMVASFTYKHFF